MTVLDAYAVVAVLTGEAAAPSVRPLLEAGDCATTPTALAEVLDHLVRVLGVDNQTASVDIAQLGLGELPVNESMGLAAGRLRAKHYHRTRCAISLADCIVAEAARTHSRPLATADPHLLDVCAAERIDVLVLPDSRGRTWVAANH